MVNSTVRPVLDFQGAVRILATRPGSVAERLGQAYREHLRGAACGRLPAPFREQCEALRSELASLYPKAEAADGADETRATELAAKVLLIYDALLKSFFA